MAKQTGPRTPKGKQASSGNSVTHGCRSKQHRILKGESAEEYEALEKRWMGEYGPDAAVDTAMVERVVQAEWRMRRCERQLAEVEEFLSEKSLFEWTEDDHKLMTRARRYYSEAIRFYNMARRDLDGMRMTREREIAAVYRAQCSLRDMPEMPPDEAGSEPEVSSGDGGSAERSFKGERSGGSTRVNPLRGGGGR